MTAFGRRRALSLNMRLIHLRIRKALAVVVRNRVLYSQEMQQKYRTSVARARLRCALSAEDLGRFGTELLHGKFNGTSDAVPAVRLKKLPGAIAGRVGAGGGSGALVGRVGARGGRGWPLLHYHHYSTVVTD
jgi:hypothetical protein